MPSHARPDLLSASLRAGPRVPRPRDWHEPTDARYLTKAEKITNDSSAVFVFKSPSTDQSFIFALNVVEATGDLYFHLEAPAGQAWAAVGIASGHSEPTYSKSLNVELLWPAGLDDSNTISRDGMLRADGVCRNCTTWSSGDGLLGYVSFSVPFIFAVGPSQPMRSSSLDASMRRHDFYGHFTMNVTAATSRDVGSVPRPNSGNGAYESQGVSEARNMIGDNNTAPAAHALIMIAAFILALVLYPGRIWYWHSHLQAVQQGSETATLGRKCSFGKPLRSARALWTGSAVETITEPLVKWGCQSLATDKDRVRSSF
ncbi:hypothetical protein L1887_63467 [Cichorium endivia]|nr:hypothetical protein L1887_63467 [Cichorium endivia]